MRELPGAVEQLHAEPGPFHSKLGRVLAHRKATLSDVRGLRKTIGIYLIATDHFRGLVLPGDKRIPGDYGRKAGKYTDFNVRSKKKQARLRARFRGLSNELNELDGIVLVGVPLFPFALDGGSSLPEGIGRIAATLSHELTHALDFKPIEKPSKSEKHQVDAKPHGIKRKRKKRSREKPKDESEIEKQVEKARAEQMAARFLGKTKYYNEPREVRAHVHNVLNEIRDFIDSDVRFARFARGSESGMLSFFISSALDVSPRWRTMEKYLTPHNRKRMMQMIVTALEDEGIIKID